VVAFSTERGMSFAFSATIYASAAILFLRVTEPKRYALFAGRHPAESGRHLTSHDDYASLICNEYNDAYGVIIIYRPVE
jgi:hypothetical protein